jgi:cytidylate kinase
MDLPWNHRSRPRDLGSIVDAQILKSELSPGLSAGKETGWPVVAMSREFGTMGQAVGERVANQLGFNSWDRELVKTVAERLHTSEFIVSAFDERARSLLEDFFSSAWDQDRLSVKYGELLRGLVRTIARRGSAVIIGRGAQFLVDPGSSLRVRLVAPFDARVRSYEEQAQVPHEEAQRVVRAGDKERADYLRKEFGKDAADPAFYDLIINVAVYPPDRADALILMAYLAKFGSLPEGAQLAEDAERRPYPTSDAPGPPDDGERIGQH